MDLQQAIILRDKTITKQQEVLNLPVPNVRYSKQELRTGVQGRVQRKEHKRFIEKRKKQLTMYAKQRSDLDKYISSLQTLPPVGGEGIFLATAPVTSPIPTVSFLGIPRKRKIRNIKKRGRR